MNQNNNSTDITKLRIVYKIPKMDKVDVQRNVCYFTLNDTKLHFEIYYPPKLKIDSRVPLVIFTFGYSDSTIKKMIGCKLKDAACYISWGELIAANGLIAITYETQNPETDIIELISYIRQNGEALKIDENRIGIWSCSGNVLTALSVMMLNDTDFLKCSVLYYGFMKDLDDSNKVSKAADEIGFVYPESINDVKKLNQLPQNIPLFIVRAGLEINPDFNESIDQFLAKALKQNLPITLINYASGRHGFDFFDNNNESRRIIKQTIEFLQNNLLRYNNEKN